MAWSKQDLVESALEELGLGAAPNIDVTTDEKVSAMRRMDSMMAEWASEGIRIGYSLPSSKATSANLTDTADVPDWAHEAIFLHLAIKIAPSYGKTVSRETVVGANNAKMNLYSLMEPPTKAMPAELPCGAGNSYPGTIHPFVGEDEEGIRIGGEGDLEFN